MNGPGRRARGCLVAVCVGANVLEGALVLAFDPGASSSLAPQASAIAPFATFHDLRWLSVFSNSWWAFAAEAAAMLLVRGAFVGAAVGWAWPSPSRHGASGAAAASKPGVRQRWVRGILATAFLACLLAPCVVLLFASAVVPVSWLVIAGVPAALLVSLILHPVAVRRDWWRRILPLRSLGWILLSFLVATLAGVAISAAPSGVALVVDALAGVFNAWAWCGMVTSVVVRPEARRPYPVVPVALAVLVVGVSIGALTSFSNARATEVAKIARARDAGGSPISPKRGAGHPVLLLSGYGSAWTGGAVHPIPGAWQEVRFSYRGVGRDGVPLAYTGADTVKPLTELDRMLAYQVQRLAGLTGQRVDLVAESEGALVVETYLHAAPDAPVATVVLTSPLLTSGGVSYPPAPAGRWGIAAAGGMAALGRALQSTAPINLSPQNPFLRSIVREAPLLRTLATCPVGGVHQVALLALADAVGVPAHFRAAFPTVVVADFHGGMLQNPSLQRTIAAILAGKAPDRPSPLQAAEDLVRWAASSWQVPDLPASYYPLTSAGAPLTCHQIDAGLEGLLRETPS
ncbi:MAG: hypothetical protein ACRDYY_16295 [Acidimicrobiales bacterium]